ncbi:hypothetical protein [Shewanella colwelliana]|uniref:hypothetical protein n=1 Tax=Shewanella colwelliana TaxID=23 RepID=UPI0022B02A59|nr:hypothetical protein [Shewanella colwelliana]MCZ4339896.1 hypothetical protein [Shewanella colwelliana]
MNLKNEIERYSNLNGYPATSYEDLICNCGCKELHLYSDDDEGGAYVVCASCGTEYDIESSRTYIEEPQNNICNCDNDQFNIGVGKAFYPESNEARWVYVGAHCGKCGLDGVYVDWKQSA